jgi:tRNA threonylcarbamoyladenosine biosynthesis protein TsaE
MLQLDHIGINDLATAAGQIIAAGSGKALWIFYGEMGAGKTTLIKALCKELGVTDEVSSPTYSLVNEYRTSNGKVVYHFDFYRINSIEEAYDMGYEDYFYSGNTCLIEWPQRIEKLLEGEDVLKIIIEKTGELERSIRVEG